MAVLWGFDGSGGFLAGDTDTGRTAYAYVTSTHAVKAKRHPDKVAQKMMVSENALGEWRDAPHFRDADSRRLDILNEE